MWLNRNNEFVLDGELASVTEELLGDNRGFIESRDQKHVCAACCPTRMQMDRGKVEIEEARQTRERERRAFGPHYRQRERRIRSHAYSVAQLVHFVRERTCETIP